MLGVTTGVIVNCCHLEWIEVYQWWCNMDPSGQAAWVQAVGSIMAIGVAIFIPYWQKRRELEEQASNNRKIVMSAAANLEFALAYESTLFDFAPGGDGVITHEFTLDQARQFMKLRPRTREALQSAIDKSHYFSEALCEQIVRLGIESASYERIVDDFAQRTTDANAFFKLIHNTKTKISERLEKVRQLLQEYLPPPL